MPLNTKIHDDQIIKLLAAPDDNWAGILYDNYAAILYGVIYRIVRNESVAEEILIESFQRIRSNIQHYDAMRGKLLIWMINICRSLALNKQVTKENDNRTGGVYSFPGLSNKLEHDYKVLLDLLFIKGYSQVEVAEELNIPLGTVKTRSRATLQKLRNLIQSDLKVNGR